VDSKKAGGKVSCVSQKYREKIKLRIPKRQVKTKAMDPKKTGNKLSFESQKTGKNLSCESQKDREKIKLRIPKRRGKK
jgi:hypothetical protein